VKEAAHLLKRRTFVKNPADATRQINDSLEDQTRPRIRNLIPDGALEGLTNLVGCERDLFHQG